MLLRNDLSHVMPHPSETSWHTKRDMEEIPKLSRFPPFRNLVQFIQQVTGALQQQPVNGSMKHPFDWKNSALAWTDVLEQEWYARTEVDSPRAIEGIV
ncbi:hypothetical protein UY3_04250 [Chelonia mydas]|uniref:Uncharacterized protein n=1 Tax=Chelonia mydas TaxID=8469 RepID=M7BMR0_CHEMY|nr:hypothetical protein UY3_04250 [Chelonia mydas]